MKVHKISKLSACVLVVAIITACGTSSSDVGYENFESRLRGTWESNGKEDIYSGSLYIDYNSITITGYGESQTPQQADDARRPFKDFTKGTPLKGYSAEEKIFITDAGILQEGIPYNYYTTNSQTDEFLRFNFGGRQETLQKIRPN
ncbi:MAG: hypothetical protein LBC64_04260 [Fibromonadaceae bacterium]|jgi:hypothetical protein|nr:hypothetical protein [Fibromonadaceae bacterium]